MKKIISVFFSLCILIALAAPIFVFGETADYPKQIKGNFKSSSETFKGEGTFNYDENVFNEDSYVYNHSLSKMSLRLSMSAFADKSEGYSKQYRNVNELMEKLQLNEIEWNKSYTEKPTTNSIGVIVGNKKIRFEDGEYTLIAVAVRGGEYEAEWGGNFNIGNGNLHEGFRIARDEVLSFLSNYIGKNNISGPVKIWLTGYSRGAAVTNLAAAYLDEHIGEFGENINLSPKNIYAYSFESPATVKKSAENDLYNNIFNILSCKDIVTMLPMEKWNYGRYGKDYYLPSAQTNIDYPELESRMYDMYKTFVNKKQDGEISPRTFYEYSFAWSTDKGVHLAGSKSIDEAATEKYLKTITDDLADVYISPDNYSKNHQKAFISFGEKIVGEGRTVEFFEIFTGEFTSGLNPSDMASLVYSVVFGEKINASIKTTFYNSVNTTAQKMNITLDNSVAESFFLIFEKLISEHRLENLIGNIELIAEGHYPEICMAWLEATDDACYADENRQLPVKVVLNGERIRFDQEPVIENGRTLVPLRKIFEALGATVEWNQETQTVTSVLGNTTVVLTIGHNIMYVNTKPVELDVPGKIINDRTLAPVRAVAEGFNCKVEWDNNTRTVLITK